MGMSPITSLTPLWMARPLGADLEPLPMERAESPARLGDETYSPNDGQSAGGEEAGDGDTDTEKFGQELAHLGVSQAANSPTYPAETRESPAVSFFA